MRKRHYHLHCECGAVTVASQPEAACVACGRDLHFQRATARAGFETAGRGKEFWTGLAVLTLALLLFAGYLVPAERWTFWRAEAENPMPADCDWISRPMGDKHCHYVAQVREVSGRTSITWQRVNER